MGVKTWLKKIFPLYYEYRLIIAGIEGWKYGIKQFEGSYEEYHTRKYPYQLRKYHNINQGKRCFVIGNGPSLTAADLNLLKNEYTIASNRIYLMFEKTDWRPTYFTTQDEKVIRKSAKEMSKTSIYDVFINYSLYKETKGLFKGKKVNYFYLDMKDNYPKLPDFSEDISDRVYEGMTVTYFNIQLAVYMGFSEIYLIGMDHNFSQNITPDGKVVIDQTVKDHFSEKDRIEDGYPAQTYKAELAYQKAREYCEKHGIIIRNVTRGGKLEIFERCNLEDVLGGQR